MQWILFKVVVVGKFATTCASNANCPLAILTEPNAYSAKSECAPSTLNLVQIRYVSVTPMTYFRSRILLVFEVLAQEGPILRSVSILLHDLVADVFVLGKLFGVLQPFRKRFRFRLSDGNSDCSMRKQTFLTLSTFALCVPIAFRVVHIGALCVAFCTLSFRIHYTHFLWVLGSRSSTRR